RSVGPGAAAPPSRRRRAHPGRERRSPRGPRAACPLPLGLGRLRQREADGRPVALARRLHPDPAAVDLDDALDEREADAGALDLGIELLEEAEDLVVVARLDADAVVLDEQHGLVAEAGADADARLRLAA